MIDLMSFDKNTWTPDEVSPSVIDACIEEARKSDASEYLAIFQTKPYIDSLFIRKNPDNPDTSELTVEKRLTFHEGYYWNLDDDDFFRENCLHNPGIGYKFTAEDTIFEYYSRHYPDWKLQRYYTKPMRLLDHIYNCMHRGTVKEILYKAGLDELAEHIDMLDELNLLSSKPADIYDGISIRMLRALNCKCGADLLSRANYRKFLIELNRKYPMIFKEKLKEAHCQYLMNLIDKGLTVEKAGRLFDSRRLELFSIWNHAQLEMLLKKDEINQQIFEAAKRLEEIDPVYKLVTEDWDFQYLYWFAPEVKTLVTFLIYNRDEYDKLFQSSNEKRNDEWQEQKDGYVVRYPQDINDFCKEATYMSNCLLDYIDDFIHNGTDILFIRKSENADKSYITMEIRNGELVQAYRRFNDDCTYEEALWIRAYCDRHGIGRGTFKFDKNLDHLFIME